MYHEMRRTGYPECKTGMGTIELNATGGKFIARYPYPSIAIANNRANYTAAFEAQGAARPSPRMPDSRGNTRSARMSSPKRTYNLKTNAL